MRLVVTLAILAGNLFATAPPAGHQLILGAVGQTKQETQQRERDAGHRLVGVRVFRRWGEPLFDNSQRWAKRTGHIVFVSIKSRRDNGDLVRWRDIASAQPGSPLQADILRQAKQIKRFGALVYVVFNHEPEAKTSRPMGGPDAFVAAWRHIIDTYRAAGVRNARYVWTLTGPAFATNTANAYYPGDAYVDDIAADTYNWNTCHAPPSTWDSPVELLEPQRRFGLQHPDKGLMLLEWGTVEDPSQPGRKAQWIRDLTQLLASPAYRQYRAALQWDDRYSGVMSGTGCDFDNRTSPDALIAWRAMAASFTAGSACDADACTATAKPAHHRPLLPMLGIVAAMIVAGLVVVGAAVRLRRR